MVEVGRRNIPFTELKKLRREFGNGNAGRSAFRIIAKGGQCESLGSIRDGRSRCSNPAKLTIDFDAPRTNSFDQIASCMDCKDRIESDVKEEFEKQGSLFSLSINGRGRS